MTSTADTRLAVARLVQIEKAFNGAVILDRVTLGLFAGEILGLVGPNGSGKSTLTNLLCGVLEPDAGSIQIGGRPVRFRSPADAMAMGVRLLPQSIDTYPSLSVLENIFAGQELTRGPRMLAMMDWARMKSASKALLSRIGAEAFDPLRTVASLSGGQQQAVALARLLAADASVLVFDEPTTALGVPQKNSLLQIITGQAAAGRSVILISHDIDDVLDTCHRVIALRKGRVAADLKRAELDREQLAVLMSVA